MIFVALFISVCTSCTSSCQCIDGIDVSRHQGVIDWKETSRSLPKKAFVCIKCTEGATLTDRNYRINATQAKSNKLYFVGYFYYLTHSISDKLCIYISHTQQTCTKISIKKSNEGAVRAYWQVSIEKMVVSLFLLSSHFSLVWSCFLSNFYPRISSDFGLIIWHEAAMFDIFSNRR